MYRLALPLVVLLFAVRPAAGDDPALFRYSYYLFELPGAHAGCSDCYIPLLVTREPLEKGEQPEAAVIVTYERDSIWTLADRPVKLGRGAVQARERKIRFEGKVYRYQQVPNAEAIRLLEHPFGELPIHRREPPITRENETLRRVLLRDLSTDGKKLEGLPKEP